MDISESERRNTKKNKKKRNKKYPYKQGGRRRTLINSKTIQED